MIGTRIGNWMVAGNLGVGSTGTVYLVRAIEPRANEPVEAALKLVDLAATRDPDFQHRFAAEMLPLRRLTHPNIARYIDAGHHAGMLYHTHELAIGVDLATKIKALPPGEGFDWATVVHPIAVQIARALKHAHHRSILNRDLKPANIIIDDAGHVKVIDFGVAKVLNIPPLSMAATPMGTPCYLAPEYFTGKPPTRKSDLYSLGGVLYTLVCGRPPFVATNAAEYLHKHCYMLPDRPINFVPKLPLDVDELICNLMAKDPAKRPASAAALLDDLERLRGRLERKGDKIVLPPDLVDPTGVHAPLSMSGEIEPVAGNDASRRRDALLRGGILVALLLLVVGLILFAFFRPRPSAEELWQQAQPLLQSENPADWDTARDDYLDKLARWYPDRYTAEIEATKQRIRERKEQRRAIEAGVNLKVNSEAERQYRKGLAFAMVGDRDEAKAVWRSLIVVFAEVPAEAKWVALASTALSEMATR
ncbi:hypothetical protein BH11PLA2_BH11PLA2_11240 [soil metagenome]